MLFEGEVKITADKATNALIIIASAHDYRSLRKLIEKLDRARRQVYVEAAILEVTTSSSEDASLDWHTPGRFSKADIGDTFGGGNTVGFLQSGPFSPNAMGGISPTLSPAGLIGMAGGSLAGIVGKGFTLPGTDVSLPSFGVLLHWLQKDSNTQVLSTPHILTMDNVEANIEVGKKVPFQRGVMSGGGSLGSALGGSSGLASALGGLGGMGGLGGFAQTDRIDVKLGCILHAQSVNLFLPDNRMGAKNYSNIDSNLSTNRICHVQCADVGLFDSVKRFRKFVGESGLVNQAEMGASSIREVMRRSEPSTTDVQMEMGVPDGAGPTTLDDCHVINPIDSHQKVAASIDVPPSRPICHAGLR